MNTAEIIVDAQKGFCAGGSLAVPGGDEVVEVINHLTAHIVANGDVVMHSGDFHPEVTTHFIEFGGPWPRHCVEGTRDAEFHPNLDTSKSWLIRKGMSGQDDGYSALSGVVALTGQDVQDFLQEWHITTVVVNGLATDYCVLNTVLDLLGFSKNGNRLYRVIVITDAIRAVNIQPEDGVRALAAMQNAGAELMTSTEFLEEYLQAAA